MAAGKYSTRFAWLKAVNGPPDSFGERGEPSTVAAGFLWGELADVGATRSTELESERQLTTGTIRIRNYPAIAAGDQLRDAGLGTLWLVRSVVTGDNERICTVEL